jgi:hypothetical protein
MPSIGGAIHDRVSKATVSSWASHVGCCTSSITLLSLI